MSIFTSGQWDIETDFDQTAAYHMARDLELAEALRDNPNAKNTLRLYTWKPYAISLGYQQRPDSINLEACSNALVDVIKRPTGGRAVYHSEELTYAIIMRFAPEEGIYKVHNAMAESLLDLLNPFCDNALSLTSARDIDNIREVYQDGKVTNVACFTSTARYEITAGGKKVVGSAQRRFGNVVLQHGSILIGSEHLRLPEFLCLSSDDCQQMRSLLLKETTTLSEICSRTISAETLGKDMAEAASALREKIK